MAASSSERVGVEQPLTVGELFRAVAEEHRDRPALIGSLDEAVTFGELDEASERAARYLAERGVRTGDTVGLRLDKRTLTYALKLGCLKLGAPYFFVDPGNPRARVEQILKTCAPALVLSTREPALEVGRAEVIEVDERMGLDVLPEAADAPGPTRPILGTDPAYVMFTSGSTGRPKGAVMSHANVLTFVRWTRERFAITADDVFSNVNPLYFDNSVFDVYASLMNGAAVAPFDAALMRDPYAVMRRLDELRCTVYFSVPSLLVYFQTLKLVTEASFPHLRAIVFGGEGYPKPKLEQLFDAVGDRIDLVNVYGPTECTCICSAYNVTAADFEELEGYAPLGGPLPTFSFVVLDEQDRTPPLGEIGELCLGGPCVGLGYLNEPGLTAAAFTQNPTNTRHHDRIYRTGDLVRVAPEDGTVWFVGRKDTQIKHQGYRVELGEIEHALSALPGVDEAVALHTTDGGVSRIVAVVASKEALAPADLMRDVAAALPAYMVPAQVDVVEALPKNANGKIDRNLLKEQYA
jgi:D-alanine--poly(phosphoribitol) ligase subunit 1